MAQYKYRLTLKGKFVVFSLIYILFLIIVFIAAERYFEANNKTSYTEKPKSTSISKDSGTGITDSPVIDPLTHKAGSLAKSFSGKKITICFKYNHSDIPEQYLDTLNFIADSVRYDKNVLLKIEGNCSTKNTITSDPSKDEVNYKLSVKRASAVHDYLISKGIDSKRIIITGNGTSKPIKSNSTADGRILNRNSIIYFKIAE